MAGIFVTGGGGFVGRRLMAALIPTGRFIVALDRSGTLTALAGPDVTVVRGDVGDADSYRALLAGCDTVLHLAAATGRAAAAEHARVNATGTTTLVDESRRAGVTRFLFVSSIAAAFPDLRGYAYAQSKLEAERAVRSSGLRFTILRPTMILGSGAPLLSSLEKLALLPMVVVPGDGTPRVQPVHVDDVVRAILAVLDADLFNGDVFPIGGSETLPIEELLQRIRAARRGSRGAVFHVPLALLQPPLRLAEAAGLLRLLPISAGQLSSFKADGIAAPNALQDRLRDGSTDLTAMLRAKTGAVTTAAVPADDGVLEAECRVFTRYLLGSDADEYVRAKYREAHRHLALDARTPLDRVLLGFARRGSVFTHMSDVYAAVFAGDVALRRKLVLLLAILETCPPHSRVIDRAAGASKPAFLVAAASRLAWAGILLIAGSLVLAPAHVLSRSRRQRTS
jgi:NADH dehydrogenase